MLVSTHLDIKGDGMQLQVSIGSTREAAIALRHGLRCAQVIYLEGRPHHIGRKFAVHGEAYRKPVEQYPDDPWQQWIKVRAFAASCPTQGQACLGCNDCAEVKCDPACSGCDHCRRDLPIEQLGISSSSWERLVITDAGGQKLMAACHRLSEKLATVHDFPQQPSAAAPAEAERHLHLVDTA
jgi:hypothetical protein